MDQEYKNQVKLVLDVLPEVAKERCFALHGETAINLFLRNMPRLSVDIDLTYLPIEDRQTTIINISKALTRIKQSIEKKLPGSSAVLYDSIGKLFINSNKATIKLEVNLVGRGVIAEPTMMTLCESAQTEYDVFCEIQVVPLSQLYGGKICAALDRQHPRDLFDVKYLMQNEGFSSDIKKGFIYCLLGSDRPINEILNPHLLNQESVIISQFEGMSSEPFEYKEYETVRNQMVQVVQSSLTAADRNFLLQFKNLSPVWDEYNYAEFPSIRWKLENLRNLREKNPDKHTKLYGLLDEFLKKLQN